MSWAAIIAAALPVILAFVLGLIEKRSQSAAEDAPAPAGKLDSLNAALHAWKEENGAP